MRAITLEEQPVCKPPACQTQHMLIAIVIYKHAGSDATRAYAEFHAAAVVAENLAPECLKGTLDLSTVTAEWEKSPMTSVSPVDSVVVNEKPPLDMIINR